MKFALKVNVCTKTAAGNTKTDCVGQQDLGCDPRWHFTPDLYLFRRWAFVCFIRAGCVPVCCHSTKEDPCHNPDSVTTAGYIGRMASQPWLYYRHVFAMSVTLSVISVSVLDRQALVHRPLAPSPPIDPRVCKGDLTISLRESLISRYDAGIQVFALWFFFFYFFFWSYR